MNVVSDFNAFFRVVQELSFAAVTAAKNVLAID
jgi:hypothetical protein